MFNFSFPCTDISIAGKQKGMKDEEGNTTRSGLYIYGIEVIKAKRAINSNGDLRGEIDEVLVRNYE